MSIQVSPTPAEVVSGKPGDRTAYLRQLLSQRLELSESLLDADHDRLIQNLRQQAVAQVQELAIPSTRDEEWRFTNLTSLLATDFQAPSLEAIAPHEIDTWTIPEAAASRMVFVNGQYSESYSSRSNIPTTVWVGNLELALRDEAIPSKLQQYLAKQPNANEIFTALNTAGVADAAVIVVPKNVAVEVPIHLLFVSTGTSPTFIQPRVLIVAEPNSALTVIEDYRSAPESVSLTNAVTEIWLDENAQVTHTRLQDESSQSFHIGKTAVTQARSSRYATQAISVGASLSRHNLEVFHTGEQVETVLNGLAAIAQSQVADTHSAIIYAKPHGTSRQLHKAIVGDRAHAIFNGKVFVPQAAQLTDAGQLNRTLLLSPKARVDTKPQLEIVADNVKCTHGAAVGQLQTDEVFYLRSRGIDDNDARRLLVYAFAYEILDTIPLGSLKQRLSESILAQI